MAMVGGATSEITGGKFANGAISGAFVHLFSSEWRASVSGSGGAVAGGTYEKGYTLAHDSTQPWYKGWSFGKYTTTGVGAYTNAGGSVELNIGTSPNDHINDIGGAGVTTGGSGGPWRLVSAGSEVTFSSTARPLQNFSLGIGTPSLIPFETHAFRTDTNVHVFWEN